MLINNVASTEICFLYNRLDILERKSFKNKKNPTKADSQRVSKSKEVLDNTESSFKKTKKVAFFFCA